MNKNVVAKRNRKQRLFDLQDGLCAYCGKPMAAPGVTAGRQTCTFDHFIPKAHRGANHTANLLAMHAHCNEARGTRRPHPRMLETREKVLAGLAAIMAKTGHTEAFGLILPASPESS